MLDYVKGKLEVLEPNYTVIDVGGWGVSLSISLYTYKKIKVMFENEVKLYSKLVLKEDAIELYGFYDKIEREAFLLLNKVPGVGPKVAISVLSLFNVGQIKTSILNEDIKALTAVPGIGKKTAQKIILELKDRIRDLPIDIAVVDNQNMIIEAKEVLETLGFKGSEIHYVLDDCYKNLKHSDISVEEIVKQALKRLSK